MYAVPANAALDGPPRGLIPSSTTLAHVRAVYRAAHTGQRTKNATLIEEWRLVQDGQTGLFRVHRFGKDFRETTILGPLVYDNGVHAGTRWQQNRNGLTFTFSGIHERDAISDRAWDSNDERYVQLIGESVALNAFVIEVEPPNGRREWLFVDKRSGQIVREDRLERSRRFVTTYDDFRTFDGALLAGRVRSVDSLNNVREQILNTRYLDTTPDPADVAVIPTRRTLVEFPPGVPLVRLPVRFTNGLLVVRVVADGHPFDFLLDSGAAGIVIDPVVSETLSLERYGERVGATMGPFPETTSIVPSLYVGALRMRNVVTRVVPIPFRADDRTRIAGLLGFDFFAESVIHVDCERAVVEAIHASAFRVAGDVTSIALALDDKQPAVRLKIGPVAARAVLDTGANRTVLAAAFAERLEPGAEQSALTASRFHAVGGVGDAETVRLKNVELAGVTLNDALVDISSADLGFEDIDGVIGTDVLRKFDVFFDYRSNAAHLRRLTL